MDTKIAVIDCGTNTFHLMIASVENRFFKVLYKTEVPVKIGQGGINKKIIVPEAMDRAVKVISAFSEAIKKEKVNRVFAFATSAFRNADNGNDLRGRINKETGIDINIINGDKEAEYIFYGVNAAMDLGNSPSLIMDIGGGSVEFIIGSTDNIFWKQSFEIGAQRLIYLFHHHDPILKTEIRDMEKYLKINLMPLLEKIDEYKPKDLIGSSGTFDTLSEIYCHREKIKVNKKGTETPLSIEGYRAIHEKLITEPRESRIKMKGMIEMRVDMIVVASIVISLLLNYHEFENLRVSTQALKEGVLDRVLNGHFD